MISNKMAGEENYLSEVVKQRKILGSRRNVPVIKTFLDMLNILETLSKKEKRRNVEELELRLKEVEEHNLGLEEELSALKSNLEETKVVE